jgi:hypothetical protein
MQPVRGLAVVRLVTKEEETKGNPALASAKAMLSMQGNNKSTRTEEEGDTSFQIPQEEGMVF